jgi:hypothetical protein
MHHRPGPARGHGEPVIRGMLQRDREGVRRMAGICIGRGLGSCKVCFRFYISSYVCFRSSLVRLRLLNLLSPLAIFLEFTGIRTSSDSSPYI